MTKLSIHKNHNQDEDALWWRPYFASQRKMTQIWEDFWSGLDQNALVPDTFWSIAHTQFNSTQAQIHRLFSQLFNTRQMLTSWSKGTNTEPYINILENNEGLTT
jgi:hypothetical protein